MKKCVLLLALVLLLTGCGGTVYDSPEAMLDRVRAEIPIAGEDRERLHYVGSVEKSETALLWYSYGTDGDGYTYFVFTCDKEEDGGYRYRQMHTPIVRGRDIVFYMWGDDYVFCIGNPACRTLRYTDYAGTQEVTIEEGAHPFLYRTRGVPVGYWFLDEKGNELR